MVVMPSFVAFCKSLRVGEKSNFPRYMYIVDGEAEGDLQVTTSCTVAVPSSKCP